MLSGTAGYLSGAGYWEADAKVIDGQLQKEGAEGLC